MWAYWKCGTVFEVLVFGVFLMLLVEGSPRKGQELSKFLERHGGAIQRYTMTGYGDGWQHCEVVAENPQSALIHKGVPHLLITLGKLGGNSIDSGQFLGCISANFFHFWGIFTS